MPYRLIDVEVTETLPSVETGLAEGGLAIVSRRDGQVVGFAMHDVSPATQLSSADVEALLDPLPVEPAVRRSPLGCAPTITVVVCTRDRKELLGACLSAVMALLGPSDEILVVDNAPSDGGTRDLVRALGIRYEVEPCPGLDFARNRALLAATSDIVAFLDDDVVPDRHWLTSLQWVWSEHPDAGLVTGQILPYELATDPQIAFERRGGFRGGNQMVRYVGNHLKGNSIYPYAPGMFGAGANMSVRREVALRLGGFDEALDTGPPLPGGGDIDMMHRVIRAGYPLVYDPRTVVFHRHRRDADGLRRQYDSWGRSLMAYATKTYGLDPEGRPRLRRLIRWFFATQLREASRDIRGRSDAGRAALTELRGGVAGLLGAYGRSKRRSARRRLAHGNPTVAIIPWGDVVEDYIEPIGLSMDDYAERLSGGWLFGFVQALRCAGVDSIIICWSRSVNRPTRRIHLPTGSTIWILPPSRAYSAARARLGDPYAWDRSSALGGCRGTSALAGVVARLAAPYLTVTPLLTAGILRREACGALLCQEYEEGRFDVCTVLGRVLRLPVFATFQGGDHTRTGIERRLRPHAVRSARGLVIAAENEVERVRTRYRFPSNRIARIPNPLDPGTVPLSPREKARARLGIETQARVAVWHGRVDINPKGIDVLVDAWCRVRTTCAASPTLLLLGTGSGAGWLHDRIDELGLDDVRWRDEYVLDRDLIGTHLSAADVFVLPSRQEGFAVAPVEAMAAGLPVVATDAPGVRAIVGEGEAAGGVVVAREDAEALARELVRLLDDEELSRALGRKAAQRVVEHFSLDAVGVRLRAFLLQE